MADDGDRSAEYQTRLNAYALSRRKVNEGVGRADCEECDEPIPERRREANPSATRCVECQETYERDRSRE